MRERFLINSNSTYISTDYPVWSFQMRPVVFILNGRILPMDLPSNSDLQLPSNRFIDNANLIAKNFWNIPAKNINGIEILDSPEYVLTYGCDPRIPDKLQWCRDKYEEMLRPLIVIVTTHSGDVDIERTQIGTAEQHLQGFTIPQTFYVPKFYPEDIGKQAEYDVKPTLYWNPEVLTGRDGKAEIQFPVGLKPRGLQIRVEGIDLRGGIGSMMMVSDAP